MQRLLPANNIREGVGLIRPLRLGAVGVTSGRLKLRYETPRALSVAAPIVALWPQLSRTDATMAPAHRDQPVMEMYCHRGSVHTEVHRDLLHGIPADLHRRQLFHLGAVEKS